MINSSDYVKFTAVLGKYARKSAKALKAVVEIASENINGML